MNQIIKKILLSQSERFLFWITSVSTLLGFSALLIASLLYIVIEDFSSNDKDVFDENSMIIQKKVTKFSTIGLNSTLFSEKEIEDLKSKDFITDIAPFLSADYGVGISEYPGDGLPPFYADMFFQSIPDRFMDVEGNWEWNKNSEFVPIVLPRDFLMLINYGIAQSQGFPQISEDLLASARLKIHVKGVHNSTKFNGKVVGFSHKISSILVPETFILFSNQKYGTGKKPEFNRLFISIKDGSYGKLEKLMTQMNLDIHQSALDMAKIKMYISVVISIFIGTAFLLLLVSCVSFIQYSQNIIVNAKKEIDILLKLGYKEKFLARSMSRYFLFFFGFISIFSLIISILIYFLWIIPFLNQNGIITDSKIWIIFVIMFLGWIIFSGLNYLSSLKQVKKLNTTFKR